MLQPVGQDRQAVQPVSSHISSSSPVGSSSPVDMKRLFPPTLRCFSLAGGTGRLHSRFLYSHPSFFQPVGRDQQAVQQSFFSHKSSSSPVGQDRQAAQLVSTHIKLLQPGGQLRQAGQASDCQFWFSAEALLHIYAFHLLRASPVFPRSIFTLAGHAMPLSGPPSPDFIDILPEQFTVWFYRQSELQTTLLLAYTVCTLS